MAEPRRPSLRRSEPMQPQMVLVSTLATVRAVLPAEAYCAKDPRTSPQSLHPILPIWPWPQIELFSRLHDLAACKSPTSALLICHPCFSTAAFRIWSAECSTEASVRQSVICDSHIGRHRFFLSQISPDQRLWLMPEPNCVGKLTGKQPTRSSSAAQLGRS
jgi:hypothetical protein